MPGDNYSGPRSEPDWSSYPDTLDVRNSSDVEWIKSSGDPLVWHDAALACLIFRGDAHNLIAWLAEQPTLDRVTAACIFLHGSNGLRHFEGAPVNWVHMPPEQVTAYIERLCELDKLTILPDHGIAAPGDGWEPERQIAFARLQSDHRAPTRLLSQPLPTTGVAMPYLDLGEGDLVSLRSAKETMPFLFD